MTIPRKDTLNSSASAASDYSASFNVINYDNYSVQVVWSGIDTDTGTFQVSCSNNETDYNPLVAAQTMACACTSLMFNFYDASYNSVLCEYDAASNSTGNFSVHIIRKSRT